MESGLVNIIEVMYNFLTLFLLGVIVILLIREKKMIKKVPINKKINQVQNVSKLIIDNREKNNMIATRPYGLVNKLSKHGWTKEEISKKVGLPAGEIELVLKFKS